MFTTIPRRRPFLLVITAFAFLYTIISIGPPVCPPISKAAASRWSQELNNVTSIYHASHGISYGPGSEVETPRIRQATMLFEGDKDNVRQLYERALETHRKHGERWGVPTHVLKQSLVKEDSYFNKPAYLLNLILSEMTKPKNHRAEWLVWFDGDTIIMNPSIPWDVFLPPHDFQDKHILATQDTNDFNAGMMILRVHEWTLNTLTEALALPTLKADVPLPFYDQSAIAWVCDRPGYREHFLYQPRRWWNRYYHDPDGDQVGNMLLHFAGVSKTEHMPKYLEKVEQTPQQWAKDIAATTYQQEIGDYWNLLRKSRRLLERAEKWKNDDGRDQTEKAAKIQHAEKVLSETVLKQSDKKDKVEEAIEILAALLPT
ncbi:MAG: hypothetical protein Q9163_005624 [Psora crenata]